MNSRLNRIQNWTERARAAEYSVTALARDVGVSRRHLERYFLAEIGIHPQSWLIDLRRRDAQALLAAGKYVKEVAEAVGFSHAANFSREFKQLHGFSPRRGPRATWL